VISTPGAAAPVYAGDADPRDARTRLWRGCHCQGAGRDVEARCDSSLDSGRLHQQDVSTEVSASACVLAENAGRVKAVSQRRQAAHTLIVYGPLQRTARMHAALQHGTAACGWRRCWPRSRVGSGTRTYLHCNRCRGGRRRWRRSRVQFRVCDRCCAAKCCRRIGSSCSLLRGVQRRPDSRQRISAPWSLGGAADPTAGNAARCDWAVDVAALQTVQQTAADGSRLGHAAGGMLDTA
jgi:hypothetical protein